MAAKKRLSWSLGLAVFLALAGVWLVFRCAIVPAQQREHQIHIEMASVQAQTSEARIALKLLQNLETQSADASAELRRMDSEFPNTPPVVWVPERVKQYFGRFGFPELTVRQTAALEAPELPGYERILWSAHVPMKNAAKQKGDLLLAMANLAEAEPIVRVADITIEAGASEPEPRPAVFTFSTLLRKQ